MSSASYVGDAVTTRFGAVQVKITTSGSHLADVAFVQLTACDGHSQDIDSMAAPQLLQEPLAAHSAHIDGVSGAPYASAGYEESLQSSLDKAGLR